MLLKPLTVAAAGLATATAFLVPPEVSEADNEIITTLPFPLDMDSGVPSIAESQRVSVPCQQCDGDDALILMDFSVVDSTRVFCDHSGTDWV